MRWAVLWILLLPSFLAAEESVDVDAWARCLAHPEPAVRDAAELVLASLGEEAAKCLEKTEFADADARLRVRRLLVALRPLALRLLVPKRVLLTKNKLIEVGFEIRNPSPGSYVVQPPQDRSGAPTPRWNIAWSGPDGLSVKTGADLFAQIRLQDNEKLAQEPLGPGATISFRAPYRVHGARSGTLRVTATYRLDAERSLRATAVIVVSTLPVEIWRAVIRARRLENWQAAADDIRRELSWGSPKERKRVLVFLKEAARSRHWRVRASVAGILSTEAGGRPVLLELARDPDDRVARAAFTPLAYNEDLAALPYLAVERFLHGMGHPRPTRRVLTRRILASLTPSRVLPFLGRLLDASDDPVIHRQIASILRAHKVVAPLDRGGRVGKPGLAALRRAIQESREKK